MRPAPSARTPPDNHKLRLKKAKSQAAGLPAVLSSSLHGISKMGISKTVKTLSMVNQKDGFDCPGCAWPDPEHRTSFEFCENGAKAVADEAMKAKVTPEFFSGNSVGDLARLSDYELNRLGRLSHPVYLAEGASHYATVSYTHLTLPTIYSV